MSQQPEIGREDADTAIIVPEASTKAKTRTGLGDQTRKATIARKLKIEVPENRGC
jgi:hypothetical protein